MFGIGGFEFLIIVLFGFLIFGPEKLPSMAKTLGKAIAKFRDAQEDMSEKLKTQNIIDKDSDEPFKNPLDVLESVANVGKGSNSDQTSKDGQNDKDSKLNSAHKGSADKDAESASGTSDTQDTDVKDMPKAESFAARKAKYDAERQARIKAQKEQAQKEEKEKLQAEKAMAEKASNPKTSVSSKRASEAADSKEAN